MCQTCSKPGCRIAFLEGILVFVFYDYMKLLIKMTNTMLYLFPLNARETNL